MPKTKARKVVEYIFEEVTYQATKFQWDKEESETSRGLRDLLVGASGVTE